MSGRSSTRATGDDAHPASEPGKPISIRIARAAYRWWLLLLLLLIASLWAGGLLY